MEIINATAYNTEDLRHLIDVVREVCWQEHKAMIERWREQSLSSGRGWSHRPYHDLQPLPDTLRVGYYRSKKAHAKAKMVKPRSDCPRLGIAPLEKLGVPAMLVLAAAASDEDEAPSLDGDSIHAIASAISAMVQGSLRDDDEEGRQRVLSCRLRFTTLKDDKDIKVAKNEAQIANLRSKLRLVESELDHHRDRVAEFQGQRNALLEQINNLEGRNAYVLKC